MSKPIHSQDFINCPFCNSKAYFKYLRIDSVDNRRVFVCINNKSHECEVDEDLFWRERDG